MVYPVPQSSRGVKAIQDRECRRPVVREIAADCPDIAQSDRTSGKILPKIEKFYARVPRLSEVIQDRYIALIEKTRRNFQSSLSFLKLHIQPQFGKFRLDELTTDIISDAHLKLRQQGYAPAMCNKLPITLMTIYRMCQRLKVPGSEINPATGVKLLDASSNVRDRYLTKEETLRLLDAVKQIQKSRN